MASLERRLQVPSLNRWLQLSPVVALICVLCAIHRLLLRGELAFKSPAGDADDEEDPADVEARAVGAPQSMGAERVTDSRRQRKAREWLAKSSRLSTLLIWVSVGRLVMVIHYELFSCGTLNRLFRSNLLHMLRTGGSRARAGQLRWRQRGRGPHHP